MSVEVKPGLTFAEYLDQRRSNYTEEWKHFEALRADPAFRAVKSLKDVDSYLDAKDAPHGIRKMARAAWKLFQTTLLKKGMR